MSGSLLGFFLVAGGWWEEEGRMKKADSQQKEDGRELEKLPYYHGLLSRDDIESLLTKQGHFAVRQTQVNKKTYVCVSVHWNKEHHHYIVKKSPSGSGYQINGKKFPSVLELVTHYAKTKEEITPKGPQLLYPFKRQSWELFHSEIQLDKKIGEGEFGAVYKGTLIKKKQEVAIKLSTKTVSKDDREKFLREARQMRAYKHPNIVKLLGVAAVREPIMIVMELAPGGSLLNRLLRKKGLQEDIGLQSRIRYCLEAASGMAYLEKKKCIHRDVAARNCLLGAKGEAKISDFGLSHEADAYKVLTQKKLPIKWLAPETMKSKVYTSKSDVWSFGILIWEIFSDGADPYPDLERSSVQKEVVRGHRMKPPPRTPKDMTELMIQCWKEDKDRPKFSQILPSLEAIAKKHK